MHISLAATTLFVLVAYALALGDASMCLPFCLQRLSLALAEHVSLRRLYVFLLVGGITAGATVPWVSGHAVHTGHVMWTRDHEWHAMWAEAQAWQAMVLLVKEKVAAVGRVRSLLLT